MPSFIHSMTIPISHFSENTLENDFLVTGPTAAVLTWYLSSFGYCSPIPFFLKHSLSVLVCPCFPSLLIGHFSESVARLFSAWHLNVKALQDSLNHFSSSPSHSFLRWSHSVSLLYMQTIYESFINMHLRYDAFWNISPPPAYFTAYLPRHLGASWHHYHATLFTSTFSSKQASLEFSHLSKENHPLSNLYDFCVIFHLHLASSSSASSMSSILKTYPN